MDNNPRAPRKQNQLHRPQIYVNLEFGVSWSQGHLPNRHGIQYRSRGLRDKVSGGSGTYSRQVPPLNTNYLQEIPIVTIPYSSYTAANNQLQLYYQQPLSRAGQATAPRNLPPPTNTTAVDSTTNQQPNATAAAHRCRHSSNPRRFYPQLESPQEEEPEEERMPRDSRRQVHSRGRSAPPPIADSPWNVTTQPEVTMVHRTQQPAASSSSRPVPPAPAQEGSPQDNSSLWKALPELPTSFRLGEEGMPWNALSWPLGYEPEADPEHAHAMSSSYYPGERRLHPNFPAAPSSSYTSHQYEDGANVTYVPYSPAVNIEVTSPETTPPTSKSSPSVAKSPGEGRDLGALSVAMMTVDNGFENQWWNQGEREPIHINTAPATPVAGTDDFATGFVSPGPAFQQRRVRGLSASTLGWAVATPPQRPPHFTGHRSRPSDSGSMENESIVSPMTPPAYVDMRRSLSTRSDDAYSTLGRYA